MANQVYKDLKRTLRVTAQSQEAQMVNLKGTFSSYDKGSARLVFALEKDSVPFPLASLTANIYLTGEGLKVQYPCDVDRSLSIVTFLLTDEVLHTTGTIRGEVYLNYNQGQRLSAHQFSFKMDKALIDQDLEYIYQVYISDFEDIKEVYTRNFSNLQNELENVLGDLESRVSTLQTTLDELDVLKKAGDTATGLIQFGADTALAVSSNSIKHYVGAQPEGTAIRVYFNQNWGDDFTEYLDIVVGQGEAVSTDERFVLSALTKTSAYITGFAPPGYMNTKTVINGNEKAARATINYKNVWQITRNRDQVELNGDVSVSGRWTFEQPPAGLEGVTPQEFNTHVADTTRHILASERTAWNAKETPQGAQAKANTAEANAKAYTDSFYIRKNVLSSTGVYLLDTQSYTFDFSKMKQGLYVSVVRYAPGTGSMDEGYDEIFLSKEFIQKNLNKPCWIKMPGKDGEKKALKFTLSGTTGTITGYASNSQVPDNGFAITNMDSV